MSVDYPGGEQAWIAGTPWRDMRIDAAIRSGSGERSIPVSGHLILNRNPEWLLTPDDHAGFLVPSTRNELQRMPGNSGRITFTSHFRYGQPWIRVVCIDRQLESVFLRFCEGALVELSRGVGAADALDAVLERFRQLFKEVDPSISSELIVGLFAELVVLDSLLDAGIDALPGWLGPTGETHDFVFGKTHLEVKALRASGARTFRVSNIHQLEQPPGGQLFLLGVRLVPGSQTIGTMCDQIRKKIGPDRVRQFDDSLQAVGCDLLTGNQWNRKGFSCDSLGAWLVDDSFPRLVSTMLPDGVLPPGVSAVQYSVSLEHASSSTVVIPDLFEALADANRE